MTYYYRYKNMNRRCSILWLFKILSSVNQLLQCCSEVIMFTK